MYIYIWCICFGCKTCGLNPPVLSHTKNHLAKNSSGASGPNLQFPVLLPHVERCPATKNVPSGSSRPFFDG